MPIYLSASWVGAGYGMPTVCTRHGRPATIRVTTRLVARLEPWAYALMVVSFLAYAIFVWATRRSVLARGWPFCPRCRGLRASRVLGGVALSVAGFAAILVELPPTATNTHVSRSGGVVLCLGMVLFLVGVVVMTRRGWAWLARASVSRDGHWVCVRGAHPGFADQVAATVARASAGWPAPTAPTAPGAMAPAAWGSPGHPAQGPAPELWRRV